MSLLGILYNTKYGNWGSVLFRSRTRLSFSFLSVFLPRLAPYQNATGCSNILLTRGYFILWPLTLSKSLTQN
ncbi:uncharacterized protein METZ01_LOCUS435269 [marine metagenome]|uniref:Uncharacterized protein n=1 Tax=marine metagenome TaxID=408172 RepID=A0A382YHX5_9ZZZZ